MRLPGPERSGTATRRRSGRRNGGGALRLPGPWESPPRLTRANAATPRSVSPQWRGSLATPRTENWITILLPPQWRGSLATPRTPDRREAVTDPARWPQWRGSLATPRTPWESHCRNGGGALRLPGRAGTPPATDGRPVTPQWRGSLATPRTTDRLKAAMEGEPRLPGPEDWSG